MPREDAESRLEDPQTRSAYADAITAEVREHSAALEAKSDGELADYLEMVGADYAEGGRVFTAADYREAARRIRIGSEGNNE